ncbi:MAG: bifunctional precorrin-2 dehydrogenase/sirohydrochlorin ferrochelatase, partial [Methanospirillum sp.]|nr:bifunctional precorrin-2 dehydrogenase/sirohydrochlorin ferrochelatase [Methanospirillum sp.]
NGGSPAVARFIREHFEKTWPHLDLMITLEDELKQNLKERQIPESRRREILTSILYDDEIWQALQRGLEPAITLAKEKYLS